MAWTEAAQRVGTPGRSRTLRAAIALLGCGALGFGLSACGSDTAESSDVTASATAVPTMTASASGESGAPSATPAAPAGQPAGAPARDGQVAEVETIPGTAPRDDRESAYLSQIKDKGIDLSKVNGAQDIGGMEDQLIGAGRSHCTAVANGAPDIYIPLAAGQLKAQGLYDGDPKQAEAIIADAAKNHLCG